MIAIIYRFTLKPGCEENYQVYWKKIANYFMNHCGAIGSCLHRSDDNLWVAYSRWPDRATWESSWPGDNMPSENFPEEIKTTILNMKDCIDEKYPELCLNVVDDLLVP